MARPKSRKNLRKAIKADLLKQLSTNNKVTDRQYTNLVDDYMTLWDIKGWLAADIEERGVTIHVCTYGKDGDLLNEKDVKNDSIADLVKVNGQMLKILSELGLKATEIKVDDGNARSSDV